MGEDIGRASARHVNEIRGINRELVEKALHMRCLAYMAQVKARLLTQTLMEMDRSKKVLLGITDEVTRQRDIILAQKQKLEVQNTELELMRQHLEELVAERTEELRKANEQLLRDIKRREEAEEDRERIRSQLYHAQKMEAIGILAGGIAHDFNNLLTTISGYSELLLMKAAASEMRGDIDMIIMAANLAAGLTRQLLTFSRKQMFEPQWLNLDAVVTEMGKMLTRLIGEDIGMTTLLDSGAVCVKADKGQVGQVVMNLAVNARDAMPKGGRLTIRTELVTLSEEDTGAVTYARPGEFVRLSVEDTGIGMNEEVRKHIFEPFFTTKGQGEGTGLGLAVVYGIVKQHEGWINAYSEPGQGAVFRIYLPAHRVTPSEKSGKDVVSVSHNGHGRRVLLVEDEEGVREFAEKVLSGHGYVVLAASTAKDAREVFDREGAGFDLILSDVVLPDGTGVELAMELKESAPGIPVLLASGYTDRKAQWEIIQERGFRYLQKPYTMAELLRAVHDAAARQGDKDT